MQSSSEQPLVGEERYVATRITAAKETSTDTMYNKWGKSYFNGGGEHKSMCDTRKCHANFPLHSAVQIFDFLVY